MVDSDAGQRVGCAVAYRFSTAIVLLYVHLGVSGARPAKEGALTGRA